MNTTSTVNLPCFDFFIDIETASKKTNAAILSIATVPFNKEMNIVARENKPFSVNIDLASRFFSGMSIDTDTQQWWIKLFVWSQSSDFKFRLFENAITSLTGFDIPWKYD